MQNGTFDLGVDDSLLVPGNTKNTNTNSLNAKSILDQIKEGKISQFDLTGISKDIKNKISTADNIYETVPKILATVSAKLVVSAESAMYLLVAKDPRAISIATNPDSKTSFSKEQINKVINLLTLATNYLKSPETLKDLYKQINTEEAKKIYALLKQPLPDDPVRETFASKDLSGLAITLAAHMQMQEDLKVQATLEASGYGISGSLKHIIQECYFPFDLIEKAFDTAIQTSNFVLLKEAYEQAVQYQYPLKLRLHNQTTFGFSYQYSWYLFEFIKNYKTNPVIVKSVDTDIKTTLEDTFSLFAFRLPISIDELANRYITLKDNHPSTYEGYLINNHRLSLKNITTNIIRDNPLDLVTNPTDLDANRNLFYSKYNDIVFARMNNQEFLYHRWYKAIDVIYKTFDTNWESHLDQKFNELFTLGYTETVFDWRALFDEHFKSYVPDWRTHRETIDNGFIIVDNYFEYTEDYLFVMNSELATTVYDDPSDAINDTDAINEGLKRLSALFNTKAA